MHINVIGACNLMALLLVKGLGQPSSGTPFGQMFKDAVTTVAMANDIPVAKVKGCKRLAAVPMGRPCKKPACSGLNAGIWGAEGLPRLQSLDAKFLFCNVFGSVDVTMPVLEFFWFRPRPRL